MRFNSICTTIFTHRRTRLKVQMQKKATTCININDGKKGFIRCFMCFSLVHTNLNMMSTLFPIVELHIILVQSATNRQNHLLKFKRKPNYKGFL